MSVRPLAAVAAMLTVAGCAGPERYQPETAGKGGYAQVRLAGDHFRVSYSAPAGTGTARLAPLALRRAAELTLEQGFALFRIESREVRHDVYLLASRDGVRVTYGGDYRSWRRYWRLYCIGQGWQKCDEDPLWPARSRPRPRMEIAYTIRLLRTRPESDRDAIDARMVLAGAVRVPE
jgi:hypothetical protein